MHAGAFVMCHDQAKAKVHALSADVVQTTCNTVHVTIRRRQIHVCSLQVHVFMFMCCSHARRAGQLATRQQLA